MVEEKKKLTFIFAQLNKIKFGRNKVNGHNVTLNFK